MNDDTELTDVQERAANRPAAPVVAAWEQVDPGRFLPRRVRGSARGQVLG